MKLTKINGKYELMLPEHRANRAEWKTGWETERIDRMIEVCRRINKLRNEKPVVWDIGTEEGDISALISKYGNAELILFEPNDRVWTNIKAIWDANELERPLAFFSGFAAAETNLHGKTYADLAIYWEKIKGELIPDHGFKELKDAGDIHQTSIDDFHEWVWRSVDIITIDVEGSEFEVLKGAAKILKTHRPTVFVSVHPEFMFRMFDQYTAELVKFMTDLGYGFEILGFDHEFHFLFEPK